MIAKILQFVPAVVCIGGSLALLAFFAWDTRKQSKKSDELDRQRQDPRP